MKEVFGIIVGIYLSILGVGIWNHFNSGAYMLLMLGAILVPIWIGINDGY